MHLTSTELFSKDRSIDGGEFERVTLKRLSCPYDTLPPDQLCDGKRPAILLLHQRQYSAYFGRRASVRTPTTVSGPAEETRRVGYRKSSS